jgi:hypothetical protein
MLFLARLYTFVTNGFPSRDESHPLLVHLFLGGGSPRIKLWIILVELPYAKIGEDPEPRLNLLCLGHRSPGRILFKLSKILFHFSSICPWLRTQLLGTTVGCYI